ncbi:hypothetical protein BA177_05330 [Woeseia oceani]|uniref:SWIM-type domain-containing protein n=1 Tax=Woeseia oceani TaxID=1548547 RepID=A0A193LE36_9GAMM|nr:hypothetical protein BA177_05330 [Woeseia oceani]
MAFRGCHLAALFATLAFVRIPPCATGAEVKELKFLVKGSAPQPYELLFIKDGNSLTAICNCPAGEHGNFCKHRISLLDGKPKGLVSDNAEQVAVVVEWLVGTDVETALLELRVVEKDKAAPKADLVAAKRKLARAMNS